MSETSINGYKKVPLSENDEKSTKIDEIVTYGYGVRHTQALLIFVCLCIGFVSRSHMGVTIVAMTNIINTAEAEQHNLTFSGMTIDHGVVNLENFTGEGIKKEHNGEVNIWDEFQSNDVNDSMSIFRKYNWPKKIQELILTSFYLGIVLTQLAMGMVAQRWGGILPLQFCLLVSGIVSLVSPWFVFWGGWRALFSVQVVHGFSQGGLFIAAQILLSEWIPASERGRFSSFVYSGTIVGTVIAFQLAGILSASDWGWPSCFWAIGGSCLLSFILLTIFGAASPDEHKTISEAEKRFITQLKSTSGTKSKRKVPWKEIMTSKHIWALLVTNLGGIVSYTFLLVQATSYIHYSLGVDLKSSGLLSSLPHIGSLITSAVFGFSSDYCINNNIVSRSNARRISNSISQYGIAVCLLVVAYTKNVTLAITFLVIAISAQAGMNTGWMVNYIDLCPNYSATVTSVGSTLGHIGVLLTPILVSNVITDVTSQYQWRILFVCIAGFIVLTNSIFVVFMSADEQPWNNRASKIKVYHDPCFVWGCVVRRGQAVAADLLNWNIETAET